MSRLQEVKKYLREHPSSVTPDRLMIVRDDPEEETAGGIYLPDQAQRVPVSGIVVLAPNKMSDMVGYRVYFRPYTETAFPLGPNGTGPEVAFVHRSDVFLVEEREER